MTQPQIRSQIDTEMNKNSYLEDIEDLSDDIKELCLTVNPHSLLSSVDESVEQTTLIPTGNDIRRKMCR